MKVKLIYITLISFLFTACSLKRKLSSNSSLSTPLIFEGQIKKIECHDYTFLSYINYDFFHTDHLLIASEKKITIDDNVFKFRNLKVLEIFGKRIKYKETQNRSFDNLVSLIIVGGIFEKKLPLWMYECSGVENLSLEVDGENFNLKSLSIFKKLSNLFIFIHGSQNLDVDGFLLNNMNLNTLSIDSEKPISFPNSIVKQSKLKSLDMNVDISGKVDSIALLTDLEDLSVGSFKNFEEEYQKLTKLKSLKNLSFKFKLNQNQYSKLQRSMPTLNLGYIER